MKVIFEIGEAPPTTLSELVPGDTFRYPGKKDDDVGVFEVCGRTEDAGPLQWGGEDIVSDRRLVLDVTTGLLHVWDGDVIVEPVTAHVAVTAVGRVG